MNKSEINDKLKSVGHTLPYFLSENKCNRSIKSIGTYGIMNNNEIHINLSKERRRYFKWFDHNCVSCRFYDENITGKLTCKAQVALEKKIVGMIEDENEKINQDYLEKGLEYFAHEDCPEKTRQLRSGTGRKTGWTRINIDWNDVEKRLIFGEKPTPIANTIHISLQTLLRHISRFRPDLLKYLTKEFKTGKQIASKKDV
jgi:hypothetical protein